MEQQISICTDCRHKGRTCHIAYRLAEQLRKAIVMAGETLPDCFEISGTASIDACDRPCTLAYNATKSAIHVFGDVKQDANIEQLLETSQQLQSGAFEAGDVSMPHVPGPVLVIEAAQSMQQ